MVTGRGKAPLTPVMAGPGRGYVRELLRRRDFIWFLALANMKARNASTALGLFWFVLDPLLLGLVYYIVFGIIFPVSRDLSYLLSGLFVFHYSAHALKGGAASITSNARLLVNTRFPRLVLPTGFVLESTLGFLGSLVILILLILPAAGTTPGWRLGMLLGIVPLHVLFTLGISTLSARLAVPFRDIVNVIPYASRLWLYLSPVIWPIERLDSISTQVGALVRINPMYSMLSVYRGALLGDRVAVSDWAVAAAWSIGVLVIGVASFVRYEGKIARYL